ncbi:MAG: hypothetical protein ACPGU7_13515 [Gammaproteobacteria bacterium]
MGIRLPLPPRLGVSPCLGLYLGVFLLLMLVAPLHVARADGAASASAATLQSQIDRLQALADKQKQVHRQLEIARDEVFRLHQRAEDNFQGNILKVYLKGSMDVYNRVVAPTSGIFEELASLAAEIALNKLVEPRIWTLSEDRVALLGLGKQAAAHNARLRRMYEALGRVMAADAERFDRAQPPLPYSAPWWGGPEHRFGGDHDRGIERTTRKLNVIRHLTLKIHEQSDAAMQRLRDQRRAVLAELETLRSRHKAQADREQRLNADMARWRVTQARRTDHPPAVAADDGRGPGIHEGPRPGREVYADNPQQQALRVQREREREERRLAAERHRALEREATVHIPADIPRDYVAGEPVVLRAVIEPLGLRGTLEWRLDDLRIGTGPELRHTFSSVGRHDLSVSLSFNGRFQDRHTDPVTVHKPMRPAHRVAYDPALEGERVQAVDLPCCAYWISHDNGVVRVSGHYTTASGEQVEYRSEPVLTYPGIPPGGMFALPNGTGYHVYAAAPTVAPDLPEGATLYLVTRMRGADVETVHRLRVHGRFDMKPAPDYSYWTLRYTTEPQGPEHSLRLD